MNRFEQHGATLATADTQAGHAVTSAIALQVVQAMQNDARAAGAYRVPQADATTIDVETILVAASAMNPGEWDPIDGCTDNPGPVGANPCFKPGGSVVEYLTHPNWTDGGPGWGGGGCDGSPDASADNTGCAQPIASFPYSVPDDGPEIGVDPRMLMVIHEAFVQ